MLVSAVQQCESYVYIYAYIYIYIVSITDSFRQPPGKCYPWRRETAVHIMIGVEGEKKISEEILIGRVK